MTTGHPSLGGVVRKIKTQAGSDAATNALTITVPSNQYGVIYKLWVSIDVNSESDLEALVDRVNILVTLGGTTVWRVDVHPYIINTAAAEHVQLDLGPWEFDFGADGLYNSVRGDNLVAQASTFGTALASRISIIYSGD